MKTKPSHKIPPHQMTPKEREFARLRYEVGMNLEQIRIMLGLGKNSNAMITRVAEKMRLQTLIDRESRKSGSTTTKQAHGYIGRQYIQPPK